MAPVQKMRKLTLKEQQPYLLAYGAAISVFSPAASAYQLVKLYGIDVPAKTMIASSAHIFPHQTFLKWAQMNSSTAVKENLSPWVAFGCIGVLQGGVYGQANVHFANVFKVGNTPNIKNMFRGVLFAGARDMVSQGVPFMFSQKLKETVFNPLLEPVLPGNDGINGQVKHWSSVLTASISATYMSQGLHNLQIKMQTEPSFTYTDTVKAVWRQHGLRALVKGAEARVSLLLIVNVLNQILLAPVWKGVPIEGEFEEDKATAPAAEEHPVLDLLQHKDHAVLQDAAMAAALVRPLVDLVE